MSTCADIFPTFATSSPCGDNLEYSPEFLALQQEVVGKPEQQFGATIIPPEPPDWTQVERQSLALCERTCDIRVVVLLTQAWAELKGLPGFADGIALLADALQTNWNCIHPSLLVDGEPDPMPRVNALVALGDLQGAAAGARSARLVSGMHGQVTLREAEALLDGSRTQSEAYPGGRPRLIESLRHAYLLEMPETQAISRALSGLARIHELVCSRIGPEWSPDFSGIERTLGTIANAMQVAVDTDPVLQDVGNTAGVEATKDKEMPLPASLMAVHWRDVSVDTRSDALLMIEKVCRYFEFHEPSHPAPFLLRRVQQTIPLDFHELLKNLAPQAADQFETWMPRSE